MVTALIIYAMSLQILKNTLFRRAVMWQSWLSGAHLPRSVCLFYIEQVALYNSNQCIQGAFERSCLLPGLRAVGWPPAPYPPASDWKSSNSARGHSDLSSTHTSKQGLCGEIIFHHKEIAAWGQEQEGCEAYEIRAVCSLELQNVLVSCTIEINELKKDCSMERDGSKNQENIFSLLLDELILLPNQISYSLNSKKAKILMSFNLWNVSYQLFITDAVIIKSLRIYYVD